ncbi:MAG: phosphate acyltransferase PlsX [Candidatus Delongbacteria bacterium]|nr:phosphate acyltransferase PlsX [Candidatus Delongbacteria bacterium]MBN2837019.1 phosphate acyltransferase PlsX [Candidatus Delongbacteria bacterium]
MKIVVDLMGGDNAPDFVIEGCEQFLSKIKDCSLELVGTKDAIERAKVLLPQQLCNFHEVETVISMEDTPISISKRKQNSTISYALNLLKNDIGDAFFSAGNSGAVIFLSLSIIGQKTDSVSPALLTLIPKSNMSFQVLLDVGASGNKLVTKDYLVYLAKSGSKFYKQFFEKDNPKIALLNIGEEKSKGTSIHVETHEILSNSEMNFIGNIEGDKIYDSDADVLVVDGFTGNITLKLMESFYDIIMKRLEQFKISELVKKSSLYPKNLEYENIGGAYLLGINKNIIIGHGKSSSKAIYSGLSFTRRVLKKKILL